MNLNRWSKWWRNWPSNWWVLESRCSRHRPLRRRRVHSWGHVWGNKKRQLRFADTCGARVNLNRGRPRQLHLHKRRKHSSRDVWSIQTNYQQSPRTWCSYGISRAAGMFLVGTSICVWHNLPPPSLDWHRANRSDKIWWGPVLAQVGPHSFRRPW